MSYCQIMVAIPARNEARTIAVCIESIDTASQRVDVAVLVVVAADSCTDSTASTARSVPVIGCDVEAIEGRWGRAGAARAAAVGHGLAMLPSDRPSWIANTDADCVVPATWLETPDRIGSQRRGNRWHRATRPRVHRGGAARCVRGLVSTSRRSSSPRPRSEHRTVSRCLSIHRGMVPAHRSRRGSCPVEHVGGQRPQGVSGHVIERAHECPPA